MVDNSPATMQSQSTVVRPQVVVIREMTVSSNIPLVFGALAMFMANVAAFLLTIGFNMNGCQFPACSSTRMSNLISGSCFAFAAVCFLLAAIFKHKKMRKAARLTYSSLPQQPVTVSPGYPDQPVIALTTMSTQHPPPYAPPTGPAPYLLSPDANQNPQTVGFTANSQPTQTYPQADTTPPPNSP